MNICFVCREYVPSARAGGIASYIHDMARGLTDTGHKVTVVTASDDTREESTAVEDGIRVIRLSGGDFCVSDVERLSILKKLRCVYRFHSYRRKVARTIKKMVDVDIVEVADFGAEGLYLEKLHIPVVVRLHTPSFLNIATLDIRSVPLLKLHRSLIPRAELKILKRAPYVSSCSQSLLTKLHGLLEFKPRISEIIRNPAPEPVKTGIQHNRHKTFEIFNAGTIVETKGIPELIGACEILRKDGLDVRLMLAGKGGTYAEALKRRKDIDWITFCGHLNREELRIRYASSDVCCFPSWWENMPMVCLEAMSCGAVVVGSASGGMTEIITDGVNGFLAPPKQVSRLADKLRAVTSLTSARRKEIGEKAVETIASMFSLDKITGQMVSYYTDVINDYRNKG